MERHALLSHARMFIGTSEILIVIHSFVTILTPQQHGGKFDILVSQKITLHRSLTSGGGDNIDAIHAYLANYGTESHRLGENVKIKVKVHSSD